MNKLKFIGWFLLLTSINAVFALTLYFLGQFDERALWVLLTVELLLFVFWGAKFFPMLYVLRARKNALVSLAAPRAIGTAGKWFNHITDSIYEGAANMIDKGNYQEKSVSAHCYIISNVLLITAATFFEQMSSVGTDVTCAILLLASIIVICHTAEEKAVVENQEPASD